MSLQCLIEDVLKQVQVFLIQSSTLYILNRSSFVHLVQVILYCDFQNLEISVMFHIMQNNWTPFLVYIKCTYSVPFPTAVHLNCPCSLQHA
jgi:hypothetical protein